MADAAKYLPTGGGNLTSDITGLLSVLKSKRTVAFAYGFMLAFIGFTVFLAFSPSPNASAPWFINLFTVNSTTSSTPDPNKSQLSLNFSHFLPNSSSASPQHDPISAASASPQTKTSRSSDSTSESPSVTKETPNVNPVNNQTQSTVITSKDNTPTTNQTTISFEDSQMASNHSASSPVNSPPVVQNQTLSTLKPDEGKVLKPNLTTNAAPAPKISVLPPPTVSQNQNLGSAGKTNPSREANAEKSVSQEGVLRNNYTASLTKKRSKGSIESLMNCDFFDGEWVKDDSYPLYKPGSCADLMDEQFNCIQNGRPDKDYQKYKWKPKGCSLPRLDGHRMLNLLRGKRLVFVGDSLNRNMWESLICVLRSSVKDKKKVYEANGRVYFRGEAAYSFIFKDYNFSVELFVSPFLVQEWEMPDKNGTKKETLRLDLVGWSADQYKDADIIVFNTGHWWTHDKTSRGRDYYQEGGHVYDELNVLEAFRRAITTWSRWVDTNINPSKSIVFFRGYSASHFSGGQWNSGGQCDSETTPIEDEKYLKEYPPKMRVLENVLKYMKTHVTYMNITRMTDFRKDGHPSTYRKQNLSPEERKSPLRFQDCSHWCLPGVPDAWNEILYAELLIRQHQSLNQFERP